MSITIRDITDEKKGAAQILQDAERKRRLARDRLIAGPYGRGRLHLRGARFVKFARKRGLPKQHGLNFLHNTGFSNMGDHTYFLHATKGWRRVTTPGLAAALGRTLGHWMQYRNDLIHATKTGDKEGIERSKRDFRRSLDV